MEPFEWEVHPEAHDAVGREVDAAVARSPRLRRFVHELRARTSTGLEHWLDHLGGAEPPPGYEPVGGGLWRHPGAQLPAVHPEGPPTVAVRVDDAAAFAAVHGGQVEGSLGGAPRTVVAWEDAGVHLLGVERRSWATGATAAGRDDEGAERALDAWRRRPRAGEVQVGLDAARRAAAEMVALVGTDLAASLAMEDERAYWESRNRAARVQRERQDGLGLGWGNHDHHTFRSSRAGFAPLLELLDTLGFVRRERFFAGAEAGWGAQVLEHPGAGIVVFADVDLEPGEVDVDYTGGLRPSDRLGTVGLWCALHGESILAAGMHHLAGQFDHAALIGDLAGLGVAHQPPFSSMPHLWQAFTAPELWTVPPRVLEPLIAAGHVTDDDAERFATAGANGSHLENLTRGGGFKGFNQHNVSVTIAATDPRRA